MQRAGFIVAMFCVTACGALEYAWPVSMYAIGQRIPNNTLLLDSEETADGAGASYWVVPSLPSGLVLDGQTGTVSGIPVGEPSAGWYDVHTSDGRGTAVALYIVVDHRIPDSWMGMPPRTKAETVQRTHFKDAKAPTG